MHLRKNALITNKFIDFQTLMILFAMLKIKVELNWS